MKPRTQALDIRTLAEVYLSAKRMVIDAGFEAEVAWQEDACLMPVTEERFLSEAAWVVLSSGMKERVIRGVFPSISTAFAEFVSAHDAALAAAEGGRAHALCAFG